VDEWKRVAVVYWDSGEELQELKGMDTMSAAGVPSRHSRTVSGRHVRTTEARC
jgi:hypothetical protein